MCVDVSFSKSDLEKIEEGQKAVATIAGKQYEGTVTRINRAAAKNEKGASIIQGEIHIDNPDTDLYLGVDARVMVEGNKAENVVVIPVEAINIGKDGSFVYVVTDGMVQKRMVTAGISSDEYTEIKKGSGSRRTGDHQCGCRHRRGHGSQSGGGLSMGQLWEYIKMALANIRMNRGRSFLTMLGIIIGVSSVILIMSVGNGARMEMEQELTAVAGGQIYIYVNSNLEEVPVITEADREAIRMLDGVKGCTSTAGNMMNSVTTGKGTFDAIVNYADPDDEFSNNSVMACADIGTPGMIFTQEMMWL